jgi:hypothetical protein
MVPRALLLLLLAAATGVVADESAPVFHFSSIVAGGVLQHGEPAAVWGEGAQPGAAVVVTLSLGDGAPPAVVDAEANAGGNWNASLPTQPVRWRVALLAVSDGAHANTTVSFGAVVHCAGQSNMDMPVACHFTNKTQCFFPKRAFHADNGTAEVAAAGRYTDQIWMIKAVNSKYETVNKPHWQTATSDDSFSSFPAAFSAVCWYTGKSLFEMLGGDTPVGLLQSSVGGSPIEYWLPPASAAHPPNNINACERDVPQCDNQYNDSFFFTDIVQQLVPATVSAVVWDQAERDVKCPVSTAAYACMQALLTTSWRDRFASPRAAFVAVQLPGYTAPINNGTGSYPGYISGEMVFHMRLQQVPRHTTSRLYINCTVPYELCQRVTPRVPSTINYSSMFIKCGVWICRLLGLQTSVMLRLSRPMTSPARQARTAQFIMSRRGRLVTGWLPRLCSCTAAPWVLRPWSPTARTPPLPA